MVRLFILALAGVLLSAQEPRSSGFPWPPEKEAALGARLAGDVRKHTRAIDDSIIHDFIERLGKRLAAHSSGGDLNWTFAVIRDDAGGSTHEPLSFPGGHIFVSTPLILAVRNEAEFAGMLAHSMAHIAERHGTRMAARGQATGLSGIPLIFMGGWMGMGAAGKDDRAPIPAGYLTTQRSNELAADRAAVNILAGAGYPAAALLEYIRRTQRVFTAESGRYSALPRREERIGALETAIANISPATGPSQPSGEFQAIQDRVRQLAAPR